MGKIISVLVLFCIHASVIGCLGFGSSSTAPEEPTSTQSQSSDLSTTSSTTIQESHTSSVPNQMSSSSVQMHNTSSSSTQIITTSSNTTSSTPALSSMSMLSSQMESSTALSSAVITIPQCAITITPVDSPYTIGTEIDIQVTASDSDLYVVQLELFIDSMVIDTETSWNISNYEYTWSTDSIGVGLHSIKAVVTNDSGRVNHCEATVDFILPKFSTYSFDANINKITTPRAQIGSFLDSDKNTHITWINSVNDESRLMYTLFSHDSKTFTTQEITTPSVTEIKWAPNIVTDDNNKPHIVYRIKRDPTQPSYQMKNGNWAVMYAGDADGDGTFTVSQVSANVNNSETNSDHMYNSNVNGRPQISFKGDTLLISYQGEANSITSQGHIVFARLVNAGWVNSLEFKPGDYTGTYEATDDKSFTLPPRMTDNMQGAYIDISNYEPHVMTNTAGTWTRNTIQGLESIFGASHPQLEVDAQGAIHYLWFKDNEDSFMHTILTGESTVSITTIPVAQSHTGNFFPATVDLTTGDLALFYERSFSNNGYIILVDSNLVSTEYLIEDVENVFGKRSINANDGYISLVTGSDGNDKIFVTVNNY
ncbi:MAG: Ig-like domain-containing protein [Reichenbachiella sp.]